MFGRCFEFLKQRKVGERKKFLPRGWLIGGRNAGCRRILGEAQYFFPKCLAAILTNFDSQSKVPAGRILKVPNDKSRFLISG